MPEQRSTFDYVSEIWSIAEYVRDVIRPADYNKLVLPFALLRRLECALEPTRDAVCKAVEKYEPTLGRENEIYCTFSGKSFYNVTSFRLNDLGIDRTLDALMEYIDGFSPNARDILTKFKIRETCQDLQNEGMLHEVCMRFAGFDLSPETVPDRMMSDIYEHLIQRYGEEIAQGAEDFMTPRDVVRLAVSLIFANEDEFLNSDNGSMRSLYDGTCGTCGFISDALDVLEEWKTRSNAKAPATIIPYGQESEGVTWAVGKTNLLLRNVGNAGQDRFDSMRDLSEHIMHGDTLSDDKFEGETFNYQLTNPPYGKEWKKEKKAVLEEAKLGFKGRFGAGLPAISDGSMLFIQNVAAKLAPIEQGGGKAAIVLSGSPLFNGDAGSGPSNIRRWLFEKDYIDCIVKLPTEIFFRTGISTYIWILSNKKPEGRRGMIQLIDASDKRVPLKRNLGNKRYEISDEQIDWITRTYIDGHDHGNSVIVPASEFMYRQVTTRRPLRMCITIDKSRTDDLFESSKPMQKLSESNKQAIRDYLTEHDGETRNYEWSYTACKELGKLMDKPKPTGDQLQKAIVNVFGVRDPEADAARTPKGNTVYDPEANDKENIPYGMDFDEYMATEVLPYAPDAVIDYKVKDDHGPLQDGQTGVVGTSISFNRYFYKYEQPRDPQDIAAEILDLEDGIEDFMKDVGIGRVKNMPANWSVTKVKFIAKVIPGATPKSTISAFWNGDIPFVTPADYITEDHYIEHWARTITEEGMNSCSTSVLPPNSVIVSNRAPIGLVAINKVPVCTNQGCKGLVVKSREYSPEYLYRLLSVADDALNALGNGTTYQELSGKALSDFVIQKPPLDVQRSIVAFLDSQCESINKAIASHRVIIDKLEEYRRGLIFHAVTGRIDCTGGAR